LYSVHLLTSELPNIPQSVKQFDGITGIPLDGVEKIYRERPLSATAAQNDYRKVNDNF